MRFYLLFLFIIFANINTYSQSKFSVSNKKAIKYYKQAGVYYTSYQDSKALECLDKCTKINKRFVEAWLFKADIYNKSEKFDQENYCYTKVENINDDFFPRFYFNWASSLLKIGEYETAKIKLIKLLSKSRVSKKLKLKSNLYIDKCDFAIASMLKPVEFSPVNLGDSINTENDEYWPTLSPREDYIIFTRLPIKGNINEDFYISKLKNDNWQKASPLNGSINTDDNEGAQTITADGSVMYFTACGRSDSFGSCDIYYSLKVNDKWSEPINIGPDINSAAWEAQPSISADGRELFFVSNRKNGIGKMDIWSSKAIHTYEDGSKKWSEPKCLSINSKDDEMSPFIHMNNSNLYFSSNRIMGMGGVDIFMSKRNFKGDFVHAENLPYPINTYADETGLIVNAAGNKAYFSSNILSDKGRDIYYFDMPKSIELEKTICPEFTVLDAIDRKPLLASISSINIDRIDTLFRNYTNAPTGRVTICNEYKTKQIYNIESKGYMLYSKICTLDSLALNREILLSPIIEGETICLNNVFFDTDSYILKKESFVELNRLFNFIKTNSVSIEIGGHTDNQGSESRNMFLSGKRASTVMNYLISKGVDAKYLSYKAYASTKPIASNDSDYGRALNRRTEIKIISVN